MAEETQKRSYNPKMFWDKIKEKTNNARAKMQDEIIQDVKEQRNDEFKSDMAQNRQAKDNLLNWQSMLRKGRKTEVPEEYVEEEIDVPEVESHVEDLPDEDINEKELIVEHPQEEEILQEDTLTPNDNTVSGGTDITPPPADEDNTSYDKSLAEQPAGDLSDRETLSSVDNKPFDESDVIDPEDMEQDVVTDEEIGLNQNEDVPLETDEGTYEKTDEEENEESPKEEGEMTDEEALEEARMLAQDDLEGFRMKGKDWSKLTTKEKLEVIKIFKEGKRPEGDTYNNKSEDTTNNYEAYTHYPTALKIAEDIREGASTALNRVERAAQQNLAGGESINNAVSRNAIPHYDYRTFFK